VGVTIETRPSMGGLHSANDPWGDNGDNGMSPLQFGRVYNVKQVTSF